MVSESLSFEAIMIPKMRKDVKTQNFAHHGVQNEIPKNSKVGGSSTCSYT